MLGFEYDRQNVDQLPLPAARAAPAALRHGGRGRATCRRTAEEGGRRDRRSWGCSSGSCWGCASSPTCRWGSSPTCPSPWWPPWTRSSAACARCLDGIFDDKVFVVSFFSNVVVAAAIVFLGDKLGVGGQLSTGVIVVLGIRIFSNVAAIRRHVFHA